MSLFDYEEVEHQNLQVFCMLVAAILIFFGIPVVGGTAGFVMTGSGFVLFFCPVELLVLRVFKRSDREDDREDKNGSTSRWPTK